MRVLYVGESHPASTSRHRADALRRIGCDVTHLDPQRDLRGLVEGRVLAAINYRTGYELIRWPALFWCRKQLSNHRDFDVVWINGGEILDRRCLSVLKKCGKYLVLYNSDDVTGKRDARRFSLLRGAIDLFDLCVVLREPNVVEYINLGCGDVLQVGMSYDEVVHREFDENVIIPDKFKSDVAFVGTWMRSENRDVFLLDIIKAGVNVSIWGDRWEKSPIWSQLRDHYRGAALSGREYVAAIQGAKICLGLLSKGNRDLHTRRSVEIPYAGGLLCAERTTEHQAMYIEGDEAVFWHDSKECTEQCMRLLADDELRERVRSNGKRRVKALGVGNEDICRLVLSRILGSA